MQDIAGTYGVTVLFALIPAMMVWQVRYSAIRGTTQDLATFELLEQQTAPQSDVGTHDDEAPSDSDIDEVNDVMRGSADDLLEYEPSPQEDLGEECKSVDHDTGIATTSLHHVGVRPLVPGGKICVVLLGVCAVAVAVQQFIFQAIL